jgi:mannose-6-phosphate isomerase-like protein (cupin superfamily)
VKPYYLAAMVLAAAISPAFAQSAPPADMQTYMSSGEVQDLIAKAKAQPAKPLIAQPILSLAPYRASLEYRNGPASPAAVHTTEAELMYVIDGSGTLVVGGELVDGKQANATNLSGSSIKDGKSIHVAQGDFTIVPENTPHQLIPDSGGPLILMTFHVPRPVPGAPQ